MDKKEKKKEKEKGKKEIDVDLETKLMNLRKSFGGTIYVTLLVANGKPALLQCIDKRFRDHETHESEEGEHDPSLMPKTESIKMDYFG